MHCNQTAAGKTPLYRLGCCARRCRCSALLYHATVVRWRGSIGELCITNHHVGSSRNNAHSAIDHELDYLHDAPPAGCNRCDILLRRSQPAHLFHSACMRDVTMKWCSSATLCHHQIWLRMARSVGKAHDLVGRFLEVFPDIRMLFFATHTLPDPTFPQSAQLWLGLSSAQCRRSASSPRWPRALLGH